MLELFINIKLKKIERFLYKWLPIIFGCHCLESRSFFYKGKKFPICARCTGELIGILIGLILIPYPLHLKTVCLCFILIVPLLVDGFTQMFTKRESNNILRCITGILFGIGIVGLFILSTKLAYLKGLALSKK